MEEYHQSREKNVEGDATATNSKIHEPTSENDTEGVRNGIGSINLREFEVH